MGGRPLRRILLVEDDPDIQTITFLALGSLGGYMVEVCGSAREAIECAAASVPDLILLDAMMPGMDGIDTLKALREIPETSAIPVVFLTARVQSSDVARYKKLGSLAVIRKPFEPTALVDTIREIWTRHTSKPAPTQRRRMDALRRSYRAELPEKLKVIAEAAAALQAGDWETQLQSLYQMIHRLAGSAAIYGFDEIGRVAGELEMWTLAVLANSALEKRPSELAELVGALDRAWKASATGGRGRRAQVPSSPDRLA